MRGVQNPHKNLKHDFCKMQTKIVVVLVLGTTEHLKFSLILQNDPPHCISIFESVLKEKRHKMVQKRQFFKICLLLIQNWNWHETPFGGMLASKSGLHFWIRALKVYRHFWPKS